MQEKLSKPNNSWRFHKFAKYESQHQPPDRIFKYVWIFLYGLYIFNLISTKNGAITVSLIVGLVLNFLWIYTFLHYERPNIALYVLMFMIVLAVDALVRMANKEFLLQSVFQSIYLGWLIFAFYLNAVILRNYCIDKKIHNIFAIDFSPSLKEEMH